MSSTSTDACKVWCASSLLLCTLVGLAIAVTSGQQAKLSCDVNQEPSGWGCQAIESIFEDEHAAFSLVQMKARQPTTKQSKPESEAGNEKSEIVITDQDADSSSLALKMKALQSDTTISSFAGLSRIATRHPAIAEGVIAVAVLGIVLLVCTPLRKRQPGQTNAEGELLDPAIVEFVATLQPVDLSLHGFCCGPRPEKSFDQPERHDDSTAESSTELTSPSLPSLCPELRLSCGAAWFAVVFKRLLTDASSFDIIGPSGSTILYAAMKDIETKQVLKLAMTPDGRYPVATVTSPEIGAGARTTKGSLTIAGPGNRPYGCLCPSSTGEFVLTCGDTQVASLTADASNGRLMLCASGNRAPVASAQVRTQSTVLAGEEYVEIRASPGNDGVLALSCMLAAIIFWDVNPGASKHRVA